MNWDNEGGKPLKTFETFPEWCDFVANDDFWNHVWLLYEWKYVKIFWVHRLYQWPWTNAKWRQEHKIWWTSVSALRGVRKGYHDLDFTSHWDEKGRDTFRGFFAELMGAGMNNIPVWRIYDGGCYEAGMLLGKILPKPVFRTLMKHFRFSSPKDLPNKGEKGYHPLQNILSGIHFVKERSQLLWEAGICNYFLFCYHFWNNFCLSFMHRWGSLYQQICTQCLQD